MFLKCKSLICHHALNPVTMHVGLSVSPSNPSMSYVPTRASGSTLCSSLASYFTTFPPHVTFCMEIILPRRQRLSAYSSLWGKWLKIPRRYFEESLSTIRLTALGQEPPPNEKRKKGRPWLKRLIDKVEDSKVVGWFKTTLHEAKEKCKELYQDITQVAVCFLKAGLYSCG